MASRRHAVAAPARQDDHIAPRRRRRTRHNTHAGYGQTIHEMREMRALAMGQYGHNNQPSHHVLWLLG